MEGNLLENGDSGKSRPADIALSVDQVTDDLKKKADGIKEKANEYFKSEFELCGTPRTALSKSCVSLLTIPSVYL